jgi:CelD/BcsL family acetyltransferase involved in cellulose biosynthesis
MGIAVAPGSVVADLADLEQQWRALAGEAAGPIEMFEWAAACLSVPGRRGGLHIESVARDGRIVALAPFETRRARGVVRRLMLGVDRYHEPMDLLAADDDARAELARALARTRLPIEFGRLPADSATVDCLRRAMGRRWVISSQPLAACPYITLDATWEEPESHLSSGRRSDLRRAWRRAQQLGRVESEFIHPLSHELDALLDEAFAVEARSWKGDAGTAVACVPEMDAFFRSYAHAICREGTLRLGFLRIDGRAVAMEIAALAREGIWLLKIGHDAEFARCSPGNLLLRDSIAEAARSGLASYEFLGESRPWITVWTKAERETLRVQAFPLTPAGIAALFADAGAKALRGARRRAVQPARVARRAVRRGAEALLAPVARRFLVGEALADALRVDEQLAARDIHSAVAFWDGPGDNPRVVADHYLAALDALGERDTASYLAIKLPSLSFQADLLGEVVERARSIGRRVHFDALGPETAERTRDAAEDALRVFPGASVSHTLPGRWRRSLDDADGLTATGRPVRVVKGEWPDPEDPDRDLRAGYLEVIDRLCGRTAEVAVATHDLTLAREALGRLRAAGTPCTLELLYGMHTRGPLGLARELGVDVRVYLPYGQAYLPYVLSSMRAHPTFGLRLLRDLVVPRRRQS